MMAPMKGRSSYVIPLLPLLQSPPVGGSTAVRREAPVISIAPAVSDRSILGSIGSPIVPNHVSDVPRPDESVERSPVVHENNRSNWKSTTVASAKFLLRGVRDASDAFPPLKSIAGILNFILQNYEVRSPPPTCFIPNAHRTTSKRKQTNKG